MCYQEKGKDYGLSMVDCQSPSRLWEDLWYVNEENQDQMNNS